jgi:hypothetical protein
MPRIPTPRQAAPLVVTALLLGLLATAGVAAFRLVTAGESMTAAATGTLPMPS